MSVVGIDLGTTNTVVACVRSGKVHVLADEHGQRLLPSVVSFHPNGEVLVGAAAKARRVIDPANTVYSHKRLIGRSWGSPEIAQARSRFAFELREGPGQGPLVHSRGQDYTLPEISAFVLKRARQIAETALGTAVDRAVITVPAHFNELQRASTKVAGRVSGLEVLRILNEPTAAALAYGLGRSGSERVAVYDFGGGTFDCTLLDLNGNVFEVLATAGDSFLGGDDVDAMIAERMADVFLKQHRQDARADSQMFERLKTTAEDIKIALSTAETHTVVVRELAHGPGGSAVDFTFTLSRRDLDAMIAPLVDRTFKVTQDALALARLTPTSFDKVILVGGSTRVPLVRKRVEAFFGAPPMDRVNPDEVVAIGAAIQAAALTEGAKRRSIPAPPPVPGKPRTLPGIRNELSDDAETGELATARAPRAATRPMGASPGPVPKAARAPSEDEPASFPDLAVPTPFEWFPGKEPGGAPSPGRPAGRPPAGFGAIDEPPSMMSSSSTNTAAKAGDMPSPIGEPEPFAAGVPGGSFGLVRDLSLISSTGTASPAAGGGPDFGHVSDLSLVSSSAAAPARPSSMDDDTESMARDGRPTQPAAPREAAKPAPKKPVVAKKQPAMSAQGGPAMLGKPPPPVAPQPFGPMQRIDDGPQSRTAAMQARAPAVVTQKSPARPEGLGSTAAMPPPTTAPPRTAPAPANKTAALGSTMPLQPSSPPHRAPADDVPTPLASPSPFAPPPPAPSTSPFGGFGAPAAAPSAPPMRSDPPAPAAPIELQTAPPKGLGFAAPVLVDVTPRALVVETAGGYTDTIIPRNAKIPCERTRRFATGRDMQTTVRVRVAQGEHQYFPQNTYLGEIELSGLRAAPRGEVTVAVTFEVDADGTLRVRARDVQTGQEARAVLQLIGVADESSVVLMINRFAQQPVAGRS